jgi:hypothetical protein
MRTFQSQGMRKRKRGRGWTTESGRAAAQGRWANSPRSEDAQLEDNLARARLDRRGAIRRIVTTIDPVTGQAQRLVVRWSCLGRCDQFDLQRADGSFIGTFGAVRLGAAIARAICP